jgi:hypothetical protein
VTKGVLVGIRNVQEAILVLVARVDVAHQCCSGWQRVVDEQEDCLLGAEWHVLAELVHELADRDVAWNEVLFLIDIRRIASRSLLDNGWNALGMFGQNA